MIRLTPQICLRHIQKYSQYTQNKSWAQWYAQVAPLKGCRVIKTLLQYKTPTASLLDVGCGTGMTFAAVSQTFSNAIALDIGDLEVKATKELLKILGLSRSVKKYDGKKIPFPSNTFDIVTSIEVIEHVNNPERMLKEIRRVLKKDGILHITTANKWWPIEPHFKLPFLSYLPPYYADWYVKITKRGDSYRDIALPSYNEFRHMVQQYFNVGDITLEVLRQYEKYGLDKERGHMILVVGGVLNVLNKLKSVRITQKLAYFFESIALNCSLGWLFIATPQK